MIIRRRRKFSLLEIFAERYESPTTTTTAPAAISCKNGFILGCATKINIPVIPATIIAVLKLSVRTITPPAATAPTAQTRSIPFFD